VSPGPSPRTSEPIFSIATVLRGSGRERELDQPRTRVTATVPSGFTLPLARFSLCFASSASQIAPSSHVASTEASSIRRVRVSSQYGAGTKFCISTCLFTQNQRVGIWHGPYVTIFLPSWFPKWCRKYIVCNLEKAHPILRSISWRASTDRDWFSSGTDRFANADCRSP